jgi:uncharacterized protein with GYD domain
MVRHIVLANLTDQGIRSAREIAGRGHGVREMIRKLASRVGHVWDAQGRAGSA